MLVKHLNWANVHEHGHTWMTHHQLRYRVFVERNQWQIPSSDGMEYDQFDTPAAHYIVRTDLFGKAIGVVRLVPTVSPYMIEKLWPDMLDGPLPKCPEVWEASRFACDHTLDAETRRAVVSDLVQHTLEFGLEQGIQSLLGVMPLGLFTRVLRPAGCPIDILRKSYRIGVHSVAAGRIHVSQDGLDAVIANRPPDLGAAHVAMQAQAMGQSSLVHV